MKPTHRKSALALNVGIRGNTHFPFSDLNNLEIADQMSKFLERRG